jgi:peroxiredoxin (alkyl hydroperoxide reductase subunit C)
MAHVTNPTFDDECGCFMTATVGQKAPQFSGAVYHAGKVTTLDTAKLKNKWLILYFYPADFTFVCPTELGDVADHYAELQKLGAEVIAISTDTEWSHKVWADISPIIKKVKYPMLADPTGEVCRAYGVYIEEDGLAQRGRFIIDPKGVLKAAEVTDGPLGRNVEEGIRQLKALQHIAKNPGQACPANWKPGNATLTPGAKLAGKL